MLDPLDRFASRLFFDHLKKKSQNLWPINKEPFLLLLKYLRETYFDPSAQFNYNCTTNCCESINSGLNKDCPALRTLNAVFSKVLKHKQGFLNKYAYVVKLDNPSEVRRPKK